MIRTLIEWAHFTWNPITGCLRLCRDINGVIYCYAYWMAQRLRGRFGYPLDDPFRPTFHRDRLLEPYKLRKASKIFTCSMGEMFGPWVPSQWITSVVKVMEDNPRHIFQVLTKCPQEMKKWSRTSPYNVWAGISIDTQTRVDGLSHLLESEAKTKFISCEPLIEGIEIDLTGIDWVIIGGKSGRNPFIPPEQWVEPLVRQARDKTIPIFLKDNLRWKKRIQEFPEL